MTPTYTTYSFLPKIGDVFFRYAHEDWWLTTYIEVYDVSNTDHQFVVEQLKFEEGVDE